MELKISSYDTWVNLKVSLHKQLDSDFRSGLMDPSSNRTLQSEINILLYETLFTRGKELRDIEIQLAEIMNASSLTLKLSKSRLRKRHKHQLEKINNSLEKLGKKIFFAKLAGQYQKNFHG